MIKITENFTDLRLNTDNEGKALFFDKIMAEMQERDFAILKIGVKMPAGAAGFFTDILAIDQINLPESVEIDGNVITFTDSNAFEIFMHEACHFEHLAVDDGYFKAPTLRGERVDMNAVIDDRTEILRRNTEYEAGWRSVYYSKIYKMGNERRVINLNLANLINYDISKQEKETFKILNKRIKAEPKGTKTLDIFSDIFAKVNKFSEWADPLHKIEI